MCHKATKATFGKHCVKIIYDLVQLAEMCFEVYFYVGIEI